MRDSALRISHRKKKNKIQRKIYAQAYVHVHKGRTEHSLIR